MKRYQLLLMLFCRNLLVCATLLDSPAFTIPQHNNKIELSKSYYGYTFSTDTSIFIDYSNQISGLLISGKTILNDDNSIVRALLVDNQGNEYLIFEDYYVFADDNMEHNFNDIAMETVILENIIPMKIMIFIHNAQFYVSKITGAVTNQNESLQAIEKRKESILAAQEEYMIDRWNKFNAKKRQYWIAGKTSISRLSYSEKKTLFGAHSNYYLSDGIEYYIGGFFVVKEHNMGNENFIFEQDSMENRDVNNTYVENFDWRDRHGKNWMTSVKNQIEPFNSTNGNGGCWIFGSVAALESHVNLYYNRLLNVDLAEQEIGSCSSYGSLYSGGLPTNAYNYILDHGIRNEECFPFQNDDTIPCETICDTPQYIISISDHYYVSKSTNQLKNALINYGPIASGFCNGYTCHVMCLCGYGIINPGDHLEFIPQTAQNNIDTIIPEYSNLIGKTFWIYKNSYGIGAGINGYLYAIYENDNTRMYTRGLSYPVTISTLTDNDIVCEDADNDGYYFWGLGTKPENCPICCPDTPDGDDSNPLLAEMDTYGNFSAYTFPYATTTINSDTTWSSDTTHCGNIIVTNNSEFTITSQITMNPAAKIIVQGGGVLNIDGGSIINATVDVQNSAKLNLLNNGTLYIQQIGNLNVRFGAEANFEYGRVLVQ